MNNATTLKELTSKLNLFQFSDIPSEYISTQILSGSTYNYSEKVNNDYTLPSELLKNITHGLFWECRKQYKNSEPNEVELYYIDGSRLLFLTPKGNLVRLCKTKDKYSFSLDYSYYHKVQNIDYYQREKAFKDSGLIEPNYIGVFTEKKINDWLNYCDAKNEIHEQIILSADSKNTEIEKEIQSFIDSVKCKVSKWSDNTEVRTDLFTVVFTHSKKSQYLSKKITFTGELTDITNITNNI